MTNMIKIINANQKKVLSCLLFKIIKNHPVATVIADNNYCWYWKIWSWTILVMENLVEKLLLVKVYSLEIWALKKNVRSYLYCLSPSTLLNMYWKPWNPWYTGTLDKPTRQVLVINWSFINLISDIHWQTINIWVTLWFT